jgi:hypothetical protein
MILAVLILCTAIAGSQMPVFKTGAGVAAHNLCSSTFVSGVPEKETYDELVGALLGRAKSLVRYHVDYTAKTVDASLLFAHAHAVYTPGYGCRLVYSSNEGAPAPIPSEEKTPADAFAPASLVSTENPALRAALENVFTDKPGSTPRHVKAVVIVKDGHVIAERYAPGFGIDTPVMSFPSRSPSQTLCLPFWSGRAA